MIDLMAWESWPFMIAIMIDILALHFGELVFRLGRLVFPDY